MMNQLESQLFESVRRKNHDLIEANRQLVALVRTCQESELNLRDKYDEQQRYVAYLERVLDEIGWNPNDKR